MDPISDVFKELDKIMREVADAKNSLAVIAMSDMPEEVKLASASAVLHEVSNQVFWAKNKVRIAFEERMKVGVKS